MKITVTRKFKLDERKVKEYMRDNQIWDNDAKKNFLLNLRYADSGLLERLSVYNGNITTEVNCE